MLKKDSKTSRAAAPHAAPLVNNAVTLAAEATKAKAASVRCILQYAPSAAAKPKFLLPRVATVRFIAGTASRRLAASVDKS